MATAPKKLTDDASAGTDIAVLQGVGTDLANFSPDELAGLTNLGYSEKAEDNLVPILAILQDNSGEVKKNHPKQIQGAEAGMLIMRSLKKVIPATEAIPVIPCAFTHYWVQWEGEPGEGRVLNQFPFDERPEEAKEVPDPQNDERMNWVMPDGSRLVDTRYWYCLMYLDGDWKSVVVPMGGTNHTVSRSWNAVQKEKRLPVDGRPKAPSWYFVYGFKTRFNSRGVQSWYTYEISELGWVTDSNLRAMGRALNESVDTGVIEPDVDSESGVLKSTGDSGAI